MPEVAIRITPGGDAYFLYSDDNPLNKLGKLQLRRASNVEFDEETQRWFIIDDTIYDSDVSPDDKILGDPSGYESRLQAIAAEVALLNELLSTGQARPEELFHE